MGSRTTLPSYPHLLAEVDHEVRKFSSAVIAMALTAIQPFLVAILAQFEDRSENEQALPSQMTAGHFVYEERAMEFEPTTFSLEG